jgi:hypothetical protein
MTPPQFPVGPHEPVAAPDDARRREWIAQIEEAPARLRAAVAGLTDTQLDTPYKNWTIRQIVHHLADSHANSYVRFKLALTEDRPTIKPYDEGRWAALADSRTGDVAAPLALFEGLHSRLVQLLHTLTPEQFARTFYHPESQSVVVLNDALSYYAWHGRHHTGQILWLRQAKGW